MVETLAHRGPDGREVWLEPDVGLGHCMLHTTPESLTERLPLRRDNLAITADARLDNRGELMGLLGCDMHRADPISDSELILAAYQRWGEDCPQRLLGDFAFVIWDFAKRELFCARDHFGVKPFHYFHQPGQRFVFATEIKAIFAFSDISRKLNEVKIADYMLASFEDKSRTFYLDVNRLPPASTMVVSRSGIRIREYWALEPQREIRLKSDAEYAEAFRSHFVEAVNCRLRSAFPVGSMLSGGLDSSSIACVANELLAPRVHGELHTFSIVFDKARKSDERQYIEKVLSSRRFSSHLIDGDRLTPFDDLDGVLWHQDEPFYAPNLSLTRGGWQSASEHGVRVLLDGVFGDNVVSHGWEHLRALANRWRLLTLARELRALIRISGRNVPLWRPLSRYIVNDSLKPYFPEPGLRAWRRFRNRRTDPSAAQCEIFQSDYCSRTQLRRRVAGAARHGRRLRSSRQSHSESLGCGMVQTALEVYSRGCGEFGVETRFPFLDKRLVEYCVAIPGEQKVSQGYTRAVVRRALQGYLPEAIRLRPDKGDLGWSFRGGFDFSRELVERTLESSGPFLSRYLDATRLHKLRDRYKNDSLVDEELLNLFLAVVLSAWHSQTASRPVT
jgi:asparagine synthase (glutamine-hydrolysing)